MKGKLMRTEDPKQEPQPVALIDSGKIGILLWMLCIIICLGIYAESHKLQTSLHNVEQAIREETAVIQQQQAKPAPHESDASL
jgi:hypothetical protein